VKKFIYSLTNPERPALMAILHWIVKQNSRYT